VVRILRYSAVGVLDAIEHLLDEPDDVIRGRLRLSIRQLLNQQPQALVLRFDGHANLVS
jgi:hypothetical protein